MHTCSGSSWSFKAAFIKCAVIAVCVHTLVEGCNPEIFVVCEIITTQVMAGLTALVFTSPEFCNSQSAFIFVRKSRKQVKISYGIKSSADINVPPNWNS